MLSFKAAILFFTILESVLAQVGPLFPVHSNGAADVRYSFTKPNQFTHPGLLHSHEDLDRMRYKVSAQEEPWYSAFQNFSADQFSKANYTLRGPAQTILRGKVTNNTVLVYDSRAAYQNAIMWYITQDESHANKTIEILDKWGTTLSSIAGLDASLSASLEGFLMVNAAEIMRWEYGWKEQGHAWQGTQGFSGVLYRVFAPPCVAVGQANYGVASIRALMAFAIFLDDVVMYNYALNEYENGYCAGLSATIDPKYGQNSESGRDQGHVVTGLSWIADIAQMAWNQGSDLYNLYDSLLLKGAEYAAKYAGFNDVPYDSSFYRCEAVLVDGPWSNISTINRGKPIPAFYKMREHYSKRAHKRTPWMNALLSNSSWNEGSTTSSDQVSWGQLLFSL